MKRIDISENVMKKVVHFERSRSQMWLQRFYIAVVVTIVIIGMYVWMSWKAITDLQGWDLLTIFAQDQEIIRDYWQDAVTTFISELPAGILLVAFVLLIGLIITIVATRKRRKVYEYRMRKLAKHSRLRENEP